MATARVIINGALRKIGVLAAGREARVNEAQDALEALQGLYQFLISSGAFGRLRDVIPKGDYTATGNERIFRNTSPVMEITLPEVVPVDWFWGDGWGPYPPLYQNAPNYDRTTPRDMAVVVIVDAFTATTVTWIYDGAVKLWQSIDNIGLDDPAPLSFRDSQGLQCLLASRIVDQFGGDMPATTALMAGQFQQSLTTRFSSPRTEGYGVFF